jgi:hypothetical protein
MQRGSVPQVPPASAAWNGWTVGKSTESVAPVTYALPCESTATAWPLSEPVPPRYVENTRAEPSGLSFVTKRSEQGCVRPNGSRHSPPA